MDKLFIEDLPISGKKVLMRVDFNVPLDSDQQVTDPTRIEAALPSIRYVLEKGGSLILMSHLGRPNDVFLPEFSLKPVKRVLERVLDRPVTMAPDCLGEEVREIVDAMQPGAVVLLENLRFHRAETHPQEAPDFAKQLAALGELYVNEAFGCSHRKHSSIYTITQYFPGKAAAGYLMKKEVDFLRKILQEPKRPFYALVGGSKVSTKMGVLKSLAQKADALFIGGGMAYTFLHAQGISVGRSILEIDQIPTAKEIMALCKKLYLPIDVKVVKELSEDAAYKELEVKGGIPDDLKGVDIGSATIALFSKELAKAKTIFWNGPVGVFEFTPFAEGTNALARAIASSKAMSVVGGGDSIAAIKKAGVQREITHISTGGGATMLFIEQGTLPGIEALSEKEVSGYLS
ncbi:MAG: phosphoglycerate kinase [Chlamydiales bacterium]